jgi:hypothetical protein
MSAVLSLHYLPNVLWMRYLLTNNCVIDVHEHFVKQTYRNRAVILSANGPMPLTIPVLKTAHKMPVNTLVTDNTVYWQRQHWESLKSAYGSAPYFIHYADAFEKIYTSHVTNLSVFEIDLLKLCIKLLKVDVTLNFSESYVVCGNEDLDLRHQINPKIKPETTFKPYLQVFAEKFPFEANLCVVDVLFNHGPRSIDYVL